MELCCNESARYVWIVFEYADSGSVVIGVYGEEEKAKAKHGESPAWRYIENYEVE